MDTTDIFLYAGYLLIIIGAFLAIIMPLIKSIDNPRSLLKTAVGVVVLGALFGVAYSMADADVATRYTAEPFNITPTVAKLVGGILMTVYALFVLALVGIVITEVTKIVK
jgi:hypothetical protein